MLTFGEGSRAYPLFHMALDVPHNIEAAVHDGVWCVIQREPYQRVVDLSTKTKTTKMRHSRYYVMTRLLEFIRTQNHDSGHALWHGFFVHVVKSAAISLQEAFMNSSIYSVARNQMTVWRGVQLSYNGDFWVGEHRGFVSVSRDRETAEYFAKGQCCVFQFQVEVGSRFIDVNNNVPSASRIGEHEKEMIFPIGSVQAIRTRAADAIIHGSLSTPTIVALTMDDVRFRDATDWKRLLHTRWRRNDDDTLAS